MSDEREQWIRKWKNRVNMPSFNAIVEDDEDARNKLIELSKDQLRKFANECYEQAAAENEAMIEYILQCRERSPEFDQENDLEDPLAWAAKKVRALKFKVEEEG